MRVTTGLQTTAVIDNQQAFKITSIIAIAPWSSICWCAVMESVWLKRGGHLTRERESNFSSLVDLRGGVRQRTHLYCKYIYMIISQWQWRIIVALKTIAKCICSIEIRLNTYIYIAAACWLIKGPSRFRTAGACKTSFLPGRKEQIFYCTPGPNSSSKRSKDLFRYKIRYPINPFKNDDQGWEQNIYCCFMTFRLNG